MPGSFPKEQASLQLCVLGPGEKAQPTLTSHPQKKYILTVLQAHSLWTAVEAMPLSFLFLASQALPGPGQCGRGSCGLGGSVTRALHLSVNLISQSLGPSGFYVLSLYEIKGLYQMLSEDASRSTK